jgi:hypothetical protein
MGGGGFIGERPAGASSWCSGNDVIGDLNKLFFHPEKQEYKDAKTASLTLFQTAATTGQWEDLLNAYNAAYKAAHMTPCPGWPTYLAALGSMTPNSTNGGNLVTASLTDPPSKVLTFGNVPDWMAVGLNVSAGGITSGQTVADFDATTVTLTAKVDATVNSGDTIAFVLPAGLALSNIQTIANVRYNGLLNNAKMKTDKHGPHDHLSSGHKVQVTNGTDISSPFIPPAGPLRHRNRTP